MNWDAIRVFARATAPWLAILFGLWTFYFISGAVWRGDWDRYLFAYAVTTPSWLTLMAAYAVTAGGFAWGDITREAGVRMLGAPLAIGALVGLLAGATLWFVYPPLFRSYCAELVECSPFVLSMASLPGSALAAVLIAPLNSTLGVLIGWITYETHPLARRRVERWGLAVLLWMGGRLVSELLLDSAQAWAPPLMALIFPASVLLVLVFVTRESRAGA